MVTPKKKAPVSANNTAKKEGTGQPQGDLSTQNDQKTKEIMSQTPQSAGDIIEQSRVIAAQTGKDPNTLAGGITQSSMNQNAPVASTPPPNSSALLNPQSATGAPTQNNTEVFMAAITAGLSEVSLFGQTSKVAQAAKVGMKLASPTSAAENIAANAAIAGKTNSWISKLASTLKNPIFVTGAIMGAIGSYPFAGYDKGEALRSIETSYQAAFFNKDQEGMQKSIDLTNEMLDPGLWKQIQESIPYANVVSANWDFYKAAKLQNAINTKRLDDATKQAAGETPEQAWERHQQEQAAAEQERVDYYNNERKKLFLWEQEAANKGMIEDAAFWAAEQAKQRAYEKADQEAIQAFWTEYQRKSQESADENRPSKLAFGLLR